MNKSELIFCITISIVLAVVFLYGLYVRMTEDAIAKAEAAAMLKGPMGFGAFMDSLPKSERAIRIGSWRK
jgi:uncharacterized membrane protein